MGFYSHIVFPRLCDLFMNRPFIAKHRQQLLASAYGDVLEIGFKGDRSPVNFAVGGMEMELAIVIGGDQFGTIFLERLADARRGALANGGNEVGDVLMGKAGF